jgi:hypothetical protein
MTLSKTRISIEPPKNSEGHANAQVVKKVYTPRSIRIYLRLRGHTGSSADSLSAAAGNRLRVERGNEANSV